LPETIFGTIMQLTFNLIAGKSEYCFVLSLSKRSQTFELFVHSTDKNEERTYLLIFIIYSLNYYIEETKNYFIIMNTKIMENILNLT
jgi:hypothetical protein